MSQNWWINLICIPCQIHELYSTPQISERIHFLFSGIEIWNPAFDVAPAELITGGLITELGVLQQPLNSEYVRGISILVCVKSNNFRISHSPQGEPRQAQRERRGEMKGVRGRKYGLRVLLCLSDIVSVRTIIQRETAAATTTLGAAFILSPSLTTLYMYIQTENRVRFVSQTRQACLACDARQMLLLLLRIKSPTNMRNDFFFAGPTKKCPRGEKSARNVVFEGGKTMSSGSER